MHALWLALVLFVAGPAWAGGDAWVATYRLQDGAGTRTLTVACDDTTVEWRMPGQPVRAWRRTADGVEHREVFAADGRVVVFAPGDLRARGRSADWSTLRALVPSADLALPAAGASRVDGRVARRHAGTRDGARVELAWLDEAALPARYVRRGPGAVRLALTSLQRQPAASAFTSTEGLRETDAADLGDEDFDAFARSHIVLGF